MDKKLVGSCGLYCGACDNYLAFQPAGKHLLKTEKFIEENLDLLRCEGCNSNSLSEHCSKCEMMQCAKSKGYLHCGECGDFPCAMIIKFRTDGEKWDFAKHRLDILNNINEINKLGIDIWLKDSAEQWTCECGQPYSYYEQVCVRCNNKLESYYNHQTASSCRR